MSFTLEVKEELSRIEYTNKYSLDIYLEAILSNGADISITLDSKKLILHSKSNTIIRNLIKNLSINRELKYNLYQKQIMHFDKPIVFYLEIYDNINYYINEYHILDEDINHKNEILANEYAKSAYLRGAFIILGSINDPNSSSYHLEYSTSDKEEAIFLQTLINSYDLNARISKRRDNYVVYLKEIDAICDLLRIIGASNTVFEIENKVINRKFVTKMKRQVNFDIANQTKTNDAAKEGLKYIRYLEYYYPLEKLDPKLLLIMKVRKENPEASLTELSKIIYDNYKIEITKSGISHRLRKIKEIALEYNKRNKDGNRH